LICAGTAPLSGLIRAANASGPAIGLKTVPVWITGSEATAPSRSGSTTALTGVSVRSGTAVLIGCATACRTGTALGSIAAAAGTASSFRAADFTTRNMGAMSADDGDPGLSGFGWNAGLVRIAAVGIDEASEIGRAILPAIVSSVTVEGLLAADAVNDATMFEYVSGAEWASSACAVARCNCSRKPGAPLAPAWGESGTAPVVEDPAPTNGEANTPPENAPSPPNPGA
jgi:hypothetical protein